MFQVRIVHRGLDLWYDLLIAGYPSPHCVLIFLHLGCCVRKAKSVDELETKSLMDCVRTVTPAMLVVLSWSYVLLANINMVGGARSTLPTPTG